MKTSLTNTERLLKNLLNNPTNEGAREAAQKALDKANQEIADTMAMKANESHEWTEDQESDLMRQLINLTKKKLKSADGFDLSHITRTSLGIDFSTSKWDSACAWAEIDERTGQLKPETWGWKSC